MEPNAYLTLICDGAMEGKTLNHVDKDQKGNGITKEHSGSSSLTSLNTINMANPQIITGLITNYWSTIILTFVTAA